MPTRQGSGLPIRGHPRQSAAPFGWVTVLLVAVLFLAPSAALGEDWIYKMRPGDNLWNITTQHLKHIRYWERLQEINGIDDPWRMLPGSEIRIPLEWVKLRPTTAKVLEVRGEVTAQLGGQGDRQPVAGGAELSSGDFLFTGADGSATLRFGDGSTLMVGPESDLQLELLRVYGTSDHVDTQLNLIRGRTESIVTPRRPGNDAPRYEIKTPAATSAVRGTRYRIGARADSQISTTEVLEGSVGVAGSGVSRAVPAGYGAITAVGSPPAAPKPLLKAPDLSILPDRVERVPFPIAIPAVADATAYRIQVATEPAFRTLFFEQVTGVGGTRVPDLPDGDYILRMRGIDVEGLEGYDGYHRVTIDARPEPPVLISPSADAQIPDETPEFRWAQPANAAGYHLQLAQDPEFDAVVADLTDVDTENVNAPQSLSPGQYYWRVATRAADGEVGPWGDTQKFKRLAPAPDLKQPEITDDSISFQWASGLPGDRYEFQFARDDGFREMVYRAVVAESGVRIDRPGPGYYFLRVRVIDSEGDVGPFGAPQRVQIPPTSYWPPFIFSVLVLILML